MFKTTKSKIIFVVIFSVICIIITALLIAYKNIDITEETNEEKITTAKEKDFPGIDLDGVYNQNDIKFEEKTYQSEKVQARYYAINGLKNITIQNNINSEIEQLALNCYREKIKDLREVENIYVNIEYSANFANTLSVDMTYTFTIADVSHINSKTLNYDLTTGEKITIDKLFTSDAPIENILRETAYYGIVEYKAERTLSGDFIVNDYGDIEGEVLQFINAYKNGKMTEFFYTPKYIYIYYNNKLISIEMKKWAEYISIYNRYLTDETIFTSNNIGIKNLYTLSNIRTGDLYYVNYQNEKNYLVKIFLEVYGTGTMYRDKQDEIIKAKIQEIEAEIEKMKKLVNQNPNNFYIMNYLISFETQQEPSTSQTVTHINEYGNTYEVTVHDFEEILKPIVKENDRKDSDEGYIYNFTDILKISPETTEEYYNLETGEKVVI